MAPRLNGAAVAGRRARIVDSSDEYQAMERLPRPVRDALNDSVGVYLAVEFAELADMGASERELIETVKRMDLRLHGRCDPPRRRCRA